MNPKNELPPANYTPEEQAKLEESRTISDAEFLTGKIGGHRAHYAVNEKGEKENLILYPFAKEIAESEMLDDLSLRAHREKKSISDNLE